MIQDLDFQMTDNKAKNLKAYHRHNILVNFLFFFDKTIKKEPLILNQIKLHKIYI